MKTNLKTKNTSGFTLIETLMGVLILSIIMIAAFSAMTSVVVGKVKLIEKTSIQKEAFYFSEKLFEMIKTGGTIDYEEYWNRSSYDTTYSSGHFLMPSGFGNYGRNGVLGILGTPSYDVGGFPYYCLSGDTSMGYNGCIASNNTTINATLQDFDYRTSLQRYGQYELQFIDYNSDADYNSSTDAPRSRGDEDNSRNNPSSSFTFHFIGDDDDLYLGQGPEAFSEGINTGELYLINEAGDERTYFRLNVRLDPNAPTGSICTGSQNMTGGGCLGTIEFLKLSGEDIGYAKGQGIFSDIAAFKASNSGYYHNDGKIDTWMIHPDFDNRPPAERIMSGYDGENYWQPLFPDTIHVKDLKFFPYPHKDLKYSWRDADPAINIAPYVRISMTLAPSWKTKRQIKGEIPEIEINTTVQLTDIFDN